MEEWLRGLVGLAANPISDVLGSVEKRIEAVYHVFTGLGTRVRNGYMGLRGRTVGWITAQIRHAQSLALTLRWFAEVYVPRLIAQAAREVRADVVSFYNRAVTVARAELAAARSYLGQLLDHVRADLGALNRWVLREVAGLVGDLNKVKNHVFGPLASPTRLVGWIIDPLVHALLEWADDHAVEMGERLVAQRTQIALRALDKAEHIITRIL